MSKYNEKEYGLFKVYDEPDYILDDQQQEEYEKSDREKQYILLKKVMTSKMDKDYWLSYFDNENPFILVKMLNDKGDNSYRKEKKYRLLFDDRTNSKEQLNRFFQGAKKINPEHAIQRNIAYANLQKGYYADTIGDIVGYEVNIPNVTTKLSGIDLLSIKDDTLYLIELKACSYGNKEESKERLIRAVLEISTYYSYVKSAKEHSKDFYNAMTKNGQSFKNIKRVIIAPKSVLDDFLFYEPKDKKYLKENFLFFEISSYKEFDFSKIQVNYTDKKLFDIKEYTMEIN